MNINKAGKSLNNENLSRTAEELKNIVPPDDLNAAMKAFMSADKSELEKQIGRIKEGGVEKALDSNPNIKSVLDSNPELLEKLNSVLLGIKKR